MKRRDVLYFMGLSVTALLTPQGFAQEASSAKEEKEEIVTLAITGMTWDSCVETVQSALESVKGVKGARVSLEDNEAVVKFDPSVAKIEDLIKAVKSARGMNRYDAEVKKKE